MKTFDLTIQDATHVEKIAGISSFVGVDASGSFGILAGHARFMTILICGLSRYRTLKQPWQYIAQPGAVLDFQNNQLSISTRHYFRDENYLRISKELQQKLLLEEQELQSVKKNLQQLEQEVLKRLWGLRRGEG